jgi:hypothetical protein
MKEYSSRPGYQLEFQKNLRRVLPQQKESQGLLTTWLSEASKPGVKRMTQWR